ncbi:response regulator transcription factor [Paracrocinitomix mangrovi]|uniref:response regulator transcription factor n=1 Tax=Paracrocinitomix mangrovi TaxID=2862509 RepID=UPI001C8D69E2|nr:response regulator transcription factor [Paracrocinitomix mangrovi]UKN01155.1 response regulator transcription factor [Paracrocinitomix mangrovi]
MTQEIKIGIAEDQTLFRHGLIQLLNELDGMQVIVEAENGQEFLDQLDENKIDVALLDYRMPVLNGTKTARELGLRHPDIKILFISMYNEEEFIISAIENGANGYITKDQDINEIELAIQSLMNTGYYMNDGTSSLIISNLLSNGRLSPTFNNKSNTLTDTEITVIKLICQEYRTSEIATMIHRGTRTVEGIRSNILKKIGAKNSSGIVMYAVKNGLIDL